MTTTEEEPTYLGCTLTGETMRTHWEDSWGEVPKEGYRRWDWRQAVASGSTQLGYWEWCQAKQEDETQEYFQTTIHLVP